MSQDPQNLASKSRKQRPNPNQPTTKKSNLNQGDDDDIFNEILADSKPTASAQPRSTPKDSKMDDFERQLQQENALLAKQLDDDDIFKDSNEFNAKVKPNLKTADFDDIDQVLDDLGVGSNSNKPLPKKPEKDNSQLKNKKKALFLGGEEEKRQEDKPKSLMNKHKRDGRPSDHLNDSGEEKMVSDLKTKMNKSNLQNSFSKVDEDFDNEEPIMPTSNKQSKTQQSESVNSEEVRILKNNIKNLEGRIDQLTKEKEASQKSENEKHINEINKINMIHQQEIENLKANQEFSKTSMQRMFEEEKSRSASLHKQEIDSLKKSFEFKEENSKRQYESKISSLEGNRNTSENLTNMSDNVRNNLDELKEILKNIKFYKSKEENEQLDKYSRKTDMLTNFESSLNERVKDLDKQRESLESLRKMLEEQLSTNNHQFNEERSRLKDKQSMMDELRLKQDQVIASQKDQILQEQSKIKKLEDELHFKKVELDRKAEQQEGTLKRELIDLASQKQEVARQKENLEMMLTKERNMLDEERQRLKGDREDFLREKLGIEETGQEVKREKEALVLEMKNFELLKAKMEEEKDNVTRIAYVMQQRSLYISEKDAELLQEKTEVENMKFEIERDKTKLRNDLHTLEQKRQDLMVKSKAFENMRYNITKEMGSFEEEKSNQFRTSNPAGLNTMSTLNKTGNQTGTGAFIQESKVFDQNLFKRDVSPLKNHTSQARVEKGSFNLDKYMHDLDKKQSSTSNDEYLLKENQELIDAKFERAHLDLQARKDKSAMSTLRMNMAHTNSGSSIGQSNRQAKNTPMSMKSIGLVSATDLDSDNKRELHD